MCKSKYREMENRFFIDLKDYPSISNEESVRLIRLAHAGDDQAREKCIEGNMRLVAKYINDHYGSCTPDWEDCIQTGCMGLCKAVDQFSLDSSVKFSTFAYYKIKGEFTIYERNCAQLHIPEHDRAKARKAIKRFSALLKEDDAKTANEAVAHEMGMSEYDYYLLISSYVGVSYLDAPICNDREGVKTIMDTLASDAPFEDYSNLRVDLENSLKHLTEDCKKIFYMHYCLNIPMREIGKKLKMSHTWVGMKDQEALNYLCYFMRGYRSYAA